MATATDENIAHQVQAGDVNAFSLLVVRYEEKITRYARKFLLRGDDVKDIVQEIFLKAYTNIRSFDATRRFSPWLYRIAHNEFVNAGKRRLRLPLFVFDLDTLFPYLRSDDTAEGRFERQELKRELDASLGKLDVKYREPLVLYYIEELAYAEIAEVLQIPVATVGVRLARGRALLKKIMDNHH